MNWVAFSLKGFFTTCLQFSLFRSGTIYIFSATMGLLWLSTVPLTTGLVGQTQGLTFLSTLAGLVFFSHQIGAFIGAWLGGRIYDLFQDYTMMWWAAIALTFFATILHLPIKEEAGALAREEGETLG